MSCSDWNSGRLVGGCALDIMDDGEDRIALRKDSSRRTIKYRCNKNIASMTTQKIVFLYCCILALFVVHETGADWIDPDTPEEAKTTYRYSTRLPPLPPTAAPTPKPTKIRRNKYGVIIDPTPSPTSSTPSPTKSPTASPTPYPTLDPNKQFELVFSDEFNIAGRSFEDGADPRWTALDKNDYTNGAFHYYSPKNIKTDDGHLVITSEAADTEIVGFDDVTLKKRHDTKHFRSGMMQSWNKFCFTGGIVEAEVVMPGKYNVGGLWPAFWLLGNLARHTYVASSEHIWPWSVSKCTKKSAWAQKISGCHEVQHYGMEKHLGRGASEMDIFEVQPGNIKANTGIFLKMTVGQPFMSSSYQIAPGRTANRPGNGEWPGPGQWYEGIRGGRNTSLNINFYGDYNHFLSDVHPEQEDYFSDAISFNRQLTEDHFTKPHVYRLEWDVPTNKSDGYLHWFLDGELVFALNGTGIVKANLSTTLSTEPSYIIFNTAISKQWGFPSTCPVNCPCKHYDCHSDDWQKRCGFSPGFCEMMLKESPEYKINWVRVYQDPDDPVQKVGCSTPERPTRKWIEAHASMYKTASDAVPLKGIQRGRGSCIPDTSYLASNRTMQQMCGGPDRGKCTAGRQCECMEGFTGPHCLAYQGFDPIVWDEPDSLSDVGFVLPRVAPKFLFSALVGLIVFLFVTLQLRRRLEGWTPIPDAKLQY